MISIKYRYKIYNTHIHNDIQMCISHEDTCICAMYRENRRWQCKKGAIWGMWDEKDPICLCVCNTKVNNMRVLASDLCIRVCSFKVDGVQGNKVSG